MRTSAESVPAPAPHEGAPTTADFEASTAHRLAALEAQRPAPLDARDNGTFDADVLAGALANLDADQIAIEMRGQLTA